jgi:hypothetical protein
MNAASKYEQLALDCLSLAEATRDTGTQDQLLRLADFYAGLAHPHHTETWASLSFWWDDDKAA